MMQAVCAFRASRFLSALVCASILSWTNASTAQQAIPDPVPPLDILEGRNFTGEMGMTGKTSGRADEFIFADGTFHSKVCLEWGFTPGPYWIRLHDGRLHFLARLTSAENGVMTYEGTVDGTVMDAHVEWIKPRWYWTMEKTFWFRGTSKAPGAGSSR